MHFPKGAAQGDAAVKAHLDFFRETDLDICKIMNENLLRGETTLTAPADLPQLRLSGEGRANLPAQVDLVKRLTDQAAGDGLPLATIHGPVVSLHHMSGRSGFFVENLDFYRACMREAPQAMGDALRRAADSLCELVRRCIDEAGCDGIYFAGLGAERSLFTDEEHDRYIRPCDLQVFEAATRSHTVNIMHICKKGITISRFRDYPAQVFNWEFGGQNPTLEEGLRTFPEDKVIMGGLDNDKGPLLEGDDQALERAVHDVLRRVEGRRFILGASCTLPGSVSAARIRAAAGACKTYRG